MLNASDVLASTAAANKMRTLLLLAVIVMSDYCVDSNSCTILFNNVVVVEITAMSEVN